MGAEASIGPYQLLEPLGRGGMGLVYRAVHRRTERVVALKTVRVRSARLLGSIRREIQALAYVRHPYVVRVLDEGLHEGVPWYAMELISGRDLRRWRADLEGEPGSLDRGTPGEASTQIPTTLADVAPRDATTLVATRWTHTL